jgi:hypothetical protein
MDHHIPTYARFQWINHPTVHAVLQHFLVPPAIGRKGYDKVLLFQWLMYKTVMGCSYRDLASMSGIDHSTFVKFRQRLLRTHWFTQVFQKLTSTLASSLQSMTLVIDSSFVETYSGHKEHGSGYSGYKEKTGYKLHQIIDHATRLPLVQMVSAGNAADITYGRRLLDRSPPRWPVHGFAADKGYDSMDFVHAIYRKWPQSAIAIPMRRSTSGNEWNTFLRKAHRTTDSALYRKRTEIERYFSRKKRVFRLGEEKTRHLKNFRAHCYLTSIMEILEWLSKPETWWELFTRLV